MKFLSLREAALRTGVAGRNHVHSSTFLAMFAVHHTVVGLSLQPDNRPTLAAELRKHPYEAELLRGDPFVESPRERSAS